MEKKPLQKHLISSCPTVSLATFLALFSVKDDNENPPKLFYRPFPIFLAIGISIIEPANEETFRSIGYRIQSSNYQAIGIVPDFESRDRDVVLVRRTTYFGETPGGQEFGMGRDWGGFEEGEVSSRATWGQGGRDRTTQKEGFQVSKRGLKGSRTREGNQQGE